MNMKNKQITKAVIPAAGLGTRFLPFTKSIPKEMLPIVDKPTIQYIVEECVASGIKDILIIVSPHKNAILNHFDYFYELEERLKLANKQDEYRKIREIADMVNIQFVRQKELLGLGHALMCAKTFVGNDPFVVLLGDDLVISDQSQKPAIAQCIDAYYQINHPIVGVQTVNYDETNKYGIIDIKENKGKGLFMIKQLVEKPDIKKAPSNYAILGRYVLTPDIFDYLKDIKKDIRGEIELTDALVQMNKKNQIYACEFSGKRYDIGNKFGYLKAIIDQAINHEQIGIDVKKYIKSIKLD